MNRKKNRNLQKHLPAFRQGDLLKTSVYTSSLLSAIMNDFPRNEVSLIHLNNNVMKIEFYSNSKGYKFQINNYYLLVLDGILSLAICGINDGVFLLDVEMEDNNYASKIKLINNITTLSQDLTIPIYFDLNEDFLGEHTYELCCYFKNQNYNSTRLNNIIRFSSFDGESRFRA